MGAGRAGRSASPSDPSEPSSDVEEVSYCTWGGWRAHLAGRQEAKLQNEILPSTDLKRSSSQHISATMQACRAGVTEVCPCHLSWQLVLQVCREVTVEEGQTFGRELASWAGGAPQFQPQV